MAQIHPFQAWRPSVDSSPKVSCVPYDVISTDEARQLAQGQPHSFLHVIRPEIDLPEGTSYKDERVYKKGAENLRHFMDEGVLTKDEDQALYIYQLVRDGHAQTGIFGGVSVDDYNNEVILKHELTRPDKEDDRTRHILTQQAHAEPVMLTCKDDAGIQEFIEQHCANEDPLYNFAAPDGVKHRLWKVTETERLESLFAELDHLYIADGHHRCKSASRAAHTKRKEQAQATGNEEFNFFPAVIFPMSEMDIMAYNRLVYSVPDNFEAQLQPFDPKKTTEPAPNKKGDVCLFINGSWLQLTLPIADDPSSVETLDVYRLQKHILEPLLGIKDPRRDDNISFVGGIRGTKELEKRVNSSTADLAISMYPTAIEELMQVSDEALLMPPKSTWFEPKIRSGLLIHTF